MTVKQLKESLIHVDDDLNVFIGLPECLIDTNNAEVVSIYGWKKEWNNGNNTLFKIEIGDNKLI